MLEKKGKRGYLNCMEQCSVALPESDRIHHETVRPRVFLPALRGGLVQYIKDNP